MSSRFYRVLLISYLYEEKSAEPFTAPTREVFFHSLLDWWRRNGRALSIAIYTCFVKRDLRRNAFWLSRFTTTSALLAFARVNSPVNDLLIFKAITSNMLLPGGIIHSANESKDILLRIFPYLFWPRLFLYLIFVPLFIFISSRVRKFSAT